MQHYASLRKHVATLHNIMQVYKWRVLVALMLPNRQTFAHADKLEVDMSHDIWHLNWGLSLPCIEKSGFAAGNPHILNSVKVYSRIIVFV